MRIALSTSGCERSNYHGLYRSFTADHGDLDYYFIAGPDVADVTRRFTWLTGRPALPPRWALGYSGSTMGYTDAPDAQARMAEFLDDCAAPRHPLRLVPPLLAATPPSAPRRYVFHWNREKFPDPAAFVAGYRTPACGSSPTSSPACCDDHPLFEEARRAGLLICGRRRRAGLGAVLGRARRLSRFHQSATPAWWKANVTAALLDLRHRLHLERQQRVRDRVADRALSRLRRQPAGARGKPLQTLLMMRASREAQAEHAPDKRPFLVTRAGAAGMQRYAQTWSGDNSTCWETLKYNIKMGLGLALSGVSNSGHDIGGFAGPRPTRSCSCAGCEAGIFMPRFIIHSWNDDGSANEPWMHPEVIAPAISA